MVYYLGCDSLFPCLPAWDEKNPAFHVDTLTKENEQRVRSKLPHEHIYYLGSHEGCGCGFRSESDGFLLAREGDDARAEAEDQAALAAFLAAIPRKGRAMQIFGCWSGDELEPIAFRRECEIRDLATQTFAFREREIITLR